MVGLECCNKAVCSTDTAMLRLLVAIGMVPCDNLC